MSLARSIARPIARPVARPITGESSGGEPPIPSPPVNAVAPVVSGTTVVGQTLTCTTGSWTGTNPKTYAYQWKRGASNVGTNSSTYTLVSGDVGSNISCVVTATNSEGSASATSNSVGPVTAIPVPPTNTVAPSISGSPNVGSTLTGSNGTWTGDATITFAYRWLVDDVAISGATASTYEPVLGDVGGMLKFEVTATNGAGSAVATSSAVGPVATTPTPPPGQSLLVDDLGNYLIDDLGNYLTASTT